MKTVTNPKGPAKGIGHLCKGGVSPLVTKALHRQAKPHADGITGFRIALNPSNCIGEETTP
jgi:hypothetical protein